MPCRVILLIVLLGLGAAAAQEPTADGDTNGDGVVDAAEERAQQQLHDSLVQAAALMEHGSATAKEAATEEIARMAIITTIDQPFHPVTYRNAAIKAGIVELLVALLSPTADATAAAQRNALAALEAIATDDPTTDLDNDHARYVCDAGAVQHVVRLLSSPQEQLQVQSAACAAILAESVPCQTALSAAKAEVPLVQLGTFGNDVAKLHALAALEQMALNNPLARERIAKGGGLEIDRDTPRYPEITRGCGSPKAADLRCSTAWAGSAVAPTFATRPPTLHAASRRPTRLCRLRSTSGPTRGGRTRRGSSTRRSSRTMSASPAPTRHRPRGASQGTHAPSASSGLRRASVNGTLASCSRIARALAPARARAQQGR